MSEHEGQGHELALTGGFDRELISHRGDSVRYLVARVEAPTMPERLKYKRVPLNVGIVVDVSGSMNGPNIESAKEAASGIVNCLQDDDLFTLVSFDSEVYLHVPGLTLNEETRKLAFAAITQMRAGSSTNLSGGWLQGAECLAEAMEPNPNRSNRLILLTDGHANAGITNSSELGALAARYREQGIYSSAVGIGNGYSTEQIEAIAAHGGGTLHDAELPHEIVEVVSAELDESLKTFADNIKFTVSGATGVRYECLNLLPVTRQHDGVEVTLGNLVYGRSREVILRLTLPPGDIGSTLAFPMRVTFERPGEGVACHVEARPVILEYAAGRQLVDQPRNTVRTRAVVTAWHGQVIRESLRFNRDMRWEAGTDYVRSQLTHFQHYCQGLEGVEKELNELRQLQHRIARPIHERACKELDMAMYHRHNSKADLRVKAIMSYAAYLNDEEQG